MLYPAIRNFLGNLDPGLISAERKDRLDLLIDYGRHRLDRRSELKLNFICTHNSRRSQLAQVWGHTFSRYFEVNARCYSGGMEETSFHPNAIEALGRCGFDILTGSGRNPEVRVGLATGEWLTCFSKRFDHPVNPAHDFAAVMTCSAADNNCPYLPGLEYLIGLTYEDPKDYDDTPEESEKYDERNRQIANELYYLFGRIKGTIT